MSRPPHENPFRVDRVTALPFYGEPVDNIVRRFRFLQCGAAIVGREGSGKSTLMRNMADQLASEFEIEWIKLPSSANRREKSIAVAKARDLPPSILLLFDGVEQLSFVPWKKVVRRKRVLVTVHRKIGSFPTLIVLSPSDEVLVALLHQLIENLPLATETFALQLLVARSGDVRQTFFDLYDAWSDGRIDGRQREWPVQLPPPLL